MMKNYCWRKKITVIGLTALMVVSSHAQEWKSMIRQKRYHDALTKIEEINRTQPGKNASYMRSAIDICLNDLKKPEASAKYIEMTTNPAMRNYFQFYVLARTGEKRKALDFLKENQISAFPVSERCEAYFRAGEINRSLGDVDSALTAYLNAVETKYQKPTFWCASCKTAGDIYAKKGEMDKAVEMYKKCLTKKVFLASRNEALFTLANILLKRNDANNALALLDENQELFEKTRGYWKVRFHIAYGNIFLALGQKIKADDFYAKAEASGPSNAQKAEIKKLRNLIAAQLISEL